MSREKRISHLRQQHELLDAEIREAEKGIVIDDLHVKALKVKKLHIKDELESLI